MTTVLAMMMIEMEYHKKVIAEELTIINGTYMARTQETCSKIMAMNRARRLKAINLGVCGDERDTGFENWDHSDPTPLVEHCLCICGMLLKTTAHTVIRKDTLNGHSTLIKACIGSTCIKCLDKIHNTQNYEKMKECYKTCPHCQERKNIYDEMCKKCKLKTICNTCQETKPMNSAENCVSCNEKIKKTKFPYRIYLQTPFSEKDSCKTVGGKWDQEKKKWYIPPDVNITPFKRWNAAAP